MPAPSELLGILSRKADTAPAKAETMLARLAGFLLFQAERSEGGEVDLSHEDIASSINLSRETVTRKLAALEHDGLISLAGYRRILVRDPSALRAAYLTELQ